MASGHDPGRLLVGLLHQHPELHEGPLLIKVVCKSEGVFMDRVLETINALKNQQDLASLEVGVVVPEQREVNSTSLGGNRHSLLYVV